MNRVDLIIPMRNEEANLSSLFAMIDPFATTLLGKVFAVEGGSQDDTRNCLIQLQQKRPWLEIVDCQTIGDLSVAWRLGSDKCIDSNWVGFMDADLFECWMAKLKDKPLPVDMIIGSRFTGGFFPTMNKSVMRRFITWSVHAIYNLIDKNSITDPAHGFRLISGPALHAFRTRETDYGVVHGNVWMMALTLASSRAGYRIREYPIQYGKRVAGKDKLVPWREGMRLLIWLATIRK